MTKLCKLTPIELALSSKEHFEENLNKFINNEITADNKKFILLQNTLWRVDKLNLYRERQLNVHHCVIDHCVIDHKKGMTQNSARPPSPSTQKEDLSFSKLLTNVGDIIPHSSYREQCKRLLSYPAGSEHIQIEGSGNQVIIHDKANIPLNWLSDLITNRKRLVVFDSHLHKF